MATIRFSTLLVLPATLWLAASLVRADERCSITRPGGVKEPGVINVDGKCCSSSTPIAATQMTASPNAWSTGWRKILYVSIKTLIGCRSARTRRQRGFACRRPSRFSPGERGVAERRGGECEELFVHDWSYRGVCILWSQPALADCQLIHATHSARSQAKAVEISQALALRSAYDLQHARGWRHITLSAHPVQGVPSGGPFVPTGFQGACTSLAR